MMKVIGLDFETFGTVSLPKHGLAPYLDDPLFRPLIASVVWEGDDGSIFTRRYDFTANAKGAGTGANTRLFQEWLYSATHIVAHNVSFERGVLKRMGFDLDRFVFMDSAVIARVNGAGSALAAAAPQLLDSPKMEEGTRLIQKFSVPRSDGTALVDDISSWTQQDHDDWATFGDYCDLDAKLSLELWLAYRCPKKELQYEDVTYRMNQRGWPVDLDLVQRMQDQYLLNRATIEREFREKFDQDEKLNLNSTPQLRVWCKERGVLANSFDEMHLEKLRRRLNERINLLHQKNTDKSKIIPLLEVLALVETKQALGGSSLTKLQKITDMVSEDGRLRNQYLHAGAGQTYRTSGRGVQMQNLRRLGSDVGDVNDTASFEHWDNDTLSHNMRQVFTASQKDGQLIVGDFSSVESRGLAWLANAKWKVDAFFRGEDMYKKQASVMYNTSYEAVTKEQRQTGKVGELSCGYGAGPAAVASFAEKMHVTLTPEAATQLVDDWREANVEIVEFWKALNEGLHKVLNEEYVEIHVGPGTSYYVTLGPCKTPESLARQNKDAKSISMSLYGSSTQSILTRVFQGCYLNGRDICYHKPSELKSGKLWLDEWSKNGQRGRYKLYGGKLAGILTQSLCREIFFRSMQKLEYSLETVPNAEIIGQFHDEIVVDYWPSDLEASRSLKHVVQTMQNRMSSTDLIDNFPMAAEIKHAYRYIK